MAEIDKLVINVEVTGDTKELGDIALLIEGIDKKTEKATSKMASFGASIKNMLKSAAFIQTMRYLGNAVNKSMEYTESLNLFNVAMGEYADEARKYAETVSEVMGIDPVQWMKAQGVFNILITGFGVTADKAAIMSKNLTQLSYDLVSFYNDFTIEEAMQKVKSGISGELEPLRNLGYDLSQARLQQEAYALGIDKSVTAMTQAEKSMLRYHAIMSQVTEVQGDMARTLDAPANQTRIFKSRINELSRAIGNIFIPILNKMLPYLIAVADLAREAAESIALFFGFTLPEVDYSSASDSVGDIATDIEEANDSAKELKRTLMGFDEINRLNDTSSGTSGAAAGGGVGFDMDIYDYEEKFLGDRLARDLDDVKAKVEDISKYVAIVGAGFAAWKLTKFIADLLIAKGKLDKFPTKMAIGITMSVVGIGLEVKGIIDAVKNELSKTSFAEILAGGGLTVAGAALIGWQFGNAMLGAGIGAIVAGIPMYITGVYDAIVNGMNWLNAVLVPLGSTMAGAGIGAIVGGPVGAGIGALIGLVVGALTDIGILIYQKWDEITDWWKTKVSEPFKREWTAMWEEEKAIFVSAWNDIKTNATSTWTGMKTEFSSAWKEMKTSATNAWTNITNSIKSNFVEIVNGARTELNELKNLFTNWKATIKTPHFEWSTTPLPPSDWKYKILDALSLPTQIPKLNVNWYAQGGFPEDGLFMANHGELVGKFSNGKTAVANNEQIIEGIYRGVYQAMKDSDSNNGGQRIVVMLPNGDVLGETVVNWHNGVVKQTGTSPLYV